MADSTKPHTYRGNCHCGAFVFEADVPEPITSGAVCNCSYCRRRGTLMYKMPDDAVFRVVKGDEDADLKTYRFGAGVIDHKFCPKCGTAVVMRMPNGPLKLVLNLNTIQGLDTWSLETRKFDGAALESSYERPKYTGPQPTAHVEGGTEYTGGCHCGKVQVALSNETLTETSPMVGECNCSICRRMGYLWVWPNGDYVVLHGDEADIGRYSFGFGMMAKTFCKTCGVPVTNKPMEKTDEEVAALPEMFRKFWEGGKLMHPVNVRVLDDVDLEKISIKRMKEMNNSPPGYVNP